MSKRIISLVLVFMLMMSSTLVFAADYDLKNKTTGETMAIDEVLYDSDLFYEVAFDQENYTIEFGDALYSLKEVQAKFDANPGMSLEDAVKGLEPVEKPEVPVEGLKVVEVSAISLTEVKLVFSAEVDAIATNNFSIEGGVVENAKLEDDNKTVILQVAGLDYDTDYVLKIEDILVDGKEAKVANENFVMPSVKALWELRLSTNAPNGEIIRNGKDSALVIAELIDSSGEVDKSANDIVLDFNTTHGNFANTRVTVQNGVAKILLRSDFDTVGAIAKIDVQVAEAAGKYRPLIGKIVGTKNIPFVTVGGSDPKPNDLPVLVAAESDQADRVILYFNQKVSPDTFVKKADGKYKVDVSKNAVLLDGVEVEISQDKGTPKVIRGFKPVDNNEKAIEVILAKVYDKDEIKPILTDNKEVFIKVEISRDGTKQDNNANFILTDTRKPEATSVKPISSRAIEIKFSESIAKADIGIDGGLLKTDENYELGEFNQVTLEDKRDVVTVRLDEKVENNFLKAGKHSVQLSSIYDFAGLTDSKNISTSQTLDFFIEEDNTKPEATVVVESPEQFRVKFNGDVTGFNKDVVKLQQLDAEAKSEDEKWKTIDKPVIKIIDVSANEYVVETTEDWTKVYDTAKTKNNYYNYEYRLFVEKEKITNVISTNSNVEDIKLSLNYKDSPLNTPDVKSPEIVKFEEVDGEKDNNFNVVMNKPVKLPGLDKSGDTPSQLQGSEIPVPVVEFLGKNKDGVQVTIEGRVLGYGDNDEADKIVKVAAKENQNLQQLVNDGYDRNWILVVRSISDDVGNTAASLTYDFIITPETEVPGDETFKVADKGVEGFAASATGDKEDIIKVMFTNAIQYTGKDENAVNISNYLLDGEKLPKGSTIVVDHSTDFKVGDDKTTYYKGIIIKLPAGTLQKNNVLTVSKYLVSSFDMNLTGLYEHPFVAELKDETTTTPSGIEFTLNLEDEMTTTSGSIEIEIEDVDGNTTEAVIVTVTEKMTLEEIAEAICAKLVDKGVEATAAGKKVVATLPKGSKIKVK